MMSILKVIVLLLLVSTVIVDSRSRRKRHLDARSSAYSNILFDPGMLNYGNNLYPIGNNWFIPGYPQYPYYNQFGYNPYSSYYGTPTSYNFIGSAPYPNAELGNQYGSMGQPYTGQSYVPMSNEWLPLPGVDRRGQPLERIASPKTNKIFLSSRRK